MAAQVSEQVLFLLKAFRYKKAHPEVNEFEGKSFDSEIFPLARGVFPSYAQRSLDNYLFLNDVLKGEAVGDPEIVGRESIEQASEDSKKAEEDIKKREDEAKEREAKERAQREQQEKYSQSSATKIEGQSEKTEEPKEAPVLAPKVITPVATTPINTSPAQTPSNQSPQAQSVADKLSPVDKFYIGSLRADRRFTLILQELTQEWQRNHPGQKMTSPEARAFLASLDKQAYKVFLVRYPSSGNVNDVAKENPQQDPDVDAVNQKIRVDSVWAQKQTGQNYQLTTGWERVSGEEFVKKNTAEYWDKFVEQFPNKARIYAEKNPDIKAAFDRYIEKTRQKAESLSDAEVFKDAPKQAERLVQPVQEQAPVIIKRDPAWVNQAMVINTPKPTSSEPEVFIAEPVPAPMPVSTPVMTQPGGGGGGSPRFNLPGFRPSLPGGLGRNIAGKGVANGARGLATKVAMGFAGVNWGWVIGGVCILFFVVPVSMMLLNQEALLPGVFNSTAQAGSEIKLTKSGPESVANGAEIKYTIKASYFGKGQADIKVMDTVPENTEFVSVDESGSQSGRSVVWEIKKLAAGKSVDLAFVVKPTKDDTWVINNAEAAILKTYDSGGGVVSGGMCPSEEAISQNRKSSPESCQYLNPGVDLFGDLTDEQINRYIDKYYSQGKTSREEFARKVGIIVSKSRAAGLNPIVLMGYWKSESRFSTYPGASDLGCAPGNAALRGFESQVDCALGLIPEGSRTARCALSKDANSPACVELRGIRESTAPKVYPKGTLSNYDIYKDQPVTYPIQTIDDFAESYGSRSPKLAIVHNIDRNNNCTHTYNELLEVILTAGACTVSSQNSSEQSSNVASGAPTQCGGNPVSFGGEKILLPLPNENSCSRTATGSCGRVSSCVVPSKIVLHTTAGSANAVDTFKYFQSGAGNRGVGSHFIIGKDGKLIQAVEMLEEKVEIAYAVANYRDHISIEMTHEGVYDNKNAVPQPQYEATLNLVRALMRQYNIPAGSIDYDWKAASDAPTSSATSGVYGHYQLNPTNRQDPGSGLIRDIRNDLK